MESSYIYAFLFLTIILFIYICFYGYKYLNPYQLNTEEKLKEMEKNSGNNIVITNGVEDNNI